MREEILFTHVQVGLVAHRGFFMKTKRGGGEGEINREILSEGL